MKFPHKEEQTIPLNYKTLSIIIIISFIHHFFMNINKRLSLKKLEINGFGHNCIRSLRVTIKELNNAF